MESAPSTTGSSVTTTITQTQTRNRVLVLRLNNEERKKPGVTWTEDTIDNEHMDKKSSKRCCIFHKKKKFAESDSDESDSDTEKAKMDDETNGEGKIKKFQRHHA